MFQWDKSIRTLDVPVGKVIHLFRSMRDVQLALPGLPAQEATAYLCQYQAANGVGTTAIFHLHKSARLAFYVNTPGEVPAGRADSMLEQALVFVESMGFLLTDLDMRLLGESDRELLWTSLPLQKGIAPAEPGSSPPPAPAQPPVDDRQEASARRHEQPVPATGAAVPDDTAPQGEAAAGVPPRGETLSRDEGQGTHANVDDLLAAVEELRTRRPGIRARKKPPSPEDLKRRRQELRENIGRILASL